MIERMIVLWVANLLTGGDGPAGDLTALAQAREMKNYTFAVQLHSGPSSGKPVEGKFQTGKPVHFKADGIEFFRQGDVLVYLDAGRWQRRRATGTTSDPLRILDASALVRAVAVLPHEQLADLAQDLDEVKGVAGKEKGTTVYPGLLKKEALRKWAPSELQPVAVDGVIDVVAVGRVVQRYTVVLRLRGKLGNADVNGKYVRTVTLRDAGSTQVEVPAAAAAALK